MATQLDLWKDLRYRLGTADAADAVVPKADKTRYLNAGMAAMYPKIFRTVRDATLVLLANTFEYELPATLDGGRLIQVEVESAATSSRYHRNVPYELLNHATQPLLIFDHGDLPRQVGGTIRLTGAMPLTPFTESVNGSETYTGPVGTEELPVLYAMGVLTARLLDGRLDHTKYSTTHTYGAAQPVDQMTASQFWFAQFELMLERWAMAFPVHN